MPSDTPIRDFHSDIVVRIFFGLDSQIRHRVVISLTVPHYQLRLTRLRRHAFNPFDPRTPMENRGGSPH